MNKKIKFDCPSCSVFMKLYSKKNEPPRYICPCCQSIFLPSEKAIEFENKRIESITKIN